ncbi:hypothetical protein GQX74_012869 [Glossina fuscipes]|nr:hypothetical protein GQX74_012869 [Glossina fuscipes]
MHSTINSAHTGLDLVIVLVAPVSIAPLTNSPPMVTFATTDDLLTRSSGDSGRSGCGVRAPSLRALPPPPPSKCNSFSESVILPHGFGNISPLDSQHGVGLALPTPSPLASGGKIPKEAASKLGSEYELALRDDLGSLLNKNPPFVVVIDLVILFAICFGVAVSDLKFAILLANFLRISLRFFVKAKASGEPPNLSGACWGVHTNNKSLDGGLSVHLFGLVSGVVFAVVDLVKPKLTICVASSDLNSDPFPQSFVIIFGLINAVDGDVFVAPCDDAN